VQEGDVNRRLRRSVSFVTGASAVIVALALMAVADGGGKLPGIGRVPIPIPGLGPPSAAPARPRQPVGTPGSERPVESRSATPTPIVVSEPVTTAPASDLVRIDQPAPVTVPAVTVPPTDKKPRPEPVPVTSPSVPPSETPPKRPFGGPGIAGVHGSGRGLGSGSAGTTSGGKKSGKHARPNKGHAKGTGKDGAKGKPPHDGSHGAPDDHGKHAVHPAGACTPAPVSRARNEASAARDRGRTAGRS
jgi:hypothetical protein